MTIRAVFFDAAGTLFQVRGSVGAIYSAAARTHGASVPPQVLETAFRERFAIQPRPSFNGLSLEQRDALERRWWYDLVRAVFAPYAVTDFDRFFDDVYSTFAGAKGWELYADTVPSLEQLRARRISLGIISNFDQRLHAVCRALGILDYFDSIQTSTGVGAAKPDREIFAAALAAHGVAPHEAVHVGDHVVEDVEGARRSGIQPVLLARAGAPPGIVAAVIETLVELPGMIDRY